MRQLYNLAGYDKGLVPDDIVPASTPSSVSTAQPPSRVDSLCDDITKVQKGKKDHRFKDSVDKFTLDRNKHRLWTPGSEAEGFKAYTPFSDKSGLVHDLVKKEAKYIPPEPAEMKEVLKVPRYHDAFRDVLELGSGAKPDILKVHGNPEYPNKVNINR